MNEHIPSTTVAEASPAQTSEVVLRTYELSKRYGQRTAVQQLDLEIHKGEIVGFLGPNGAGKTTSIRMILGLLAPTTGRVELFGRELSTDREHLLSRVGALVETPALYLHLSGRNNLRAFGAVHGGMSPQRIESVLKVVGLDTRQKDRVRGYSLGMKQRLGVAIALLNNPDLLILDEPANGLDPAGMVEMRDLIHRLSSEGKTIFLSSHLLSEVQQICSRVIFINKGKIAADRTIDELTRGQGEYEVHLERSKEALELVQQQSWGKTAHVNEAGVLITPAPEDSGRALYTFLAQANLTPDSLAPATQNLEEVFFSIINAQEGGK